MNSRRFQEITIGPRQVFLFDHEDETAVDEQRVETCLAAQVRINGPVDMKTFVGSAAASLGLPEFQVAQYLFWLAHDLKIQFRANGEKIAPNRAKQLLIKSARPCVQLALDQKVEAAVVHKACEIYRRLWPDDTLPAGLDQIQFAHKLNQQIRYRKIDLEKYAKDTKQPGFPGLADIEAGLCLLHTFGASLDAYSLIHAFVEQAEKLDQLNRTIRTLAGFYHSRQRERWQHMVHFDHTAKPTLAQPIDEPGIGEAYTRFSRILSSTRPYDSVDEAWQLYQTLKAYYDSIVAQQTRQCREAALTEVNGLIQDMKELLDDHDARDDMRNQALYALRIKEKHIHKAGGIEEIDSLVRAAREEFDLWLITLDSTQG